jgi:circadian clock protein KaiB
VHGGRDRRAREPKRITSFLLSQLQRDRRQGILWQEEKSLDKEKRMDAYLLKLFVTGQTPRSSRAIANLRRICAEKLGTNYKLRIIDVLERPQLAETEKILATPTLIKEFPLPVRRIIGDLSDTNQVLLGLELLHQESRAEEK